MIVIRTSNNVRQKKESGFPARARRDAAAHARREVRDGAFSSVHAHVCTHVLDDECMHAHACMFRMEQACT